MSFLSADRARLDTSDPEIAALFARESVRLSEGLELIACAHRDAMLEPVGREVLGPGVQRADRHQHAAGQQETGADRHDEAEREKPDETDEQIANRRERLAHGLRDDERGGQRSEGILRGHDRLSRGIGGVGHRTRCRQGQAIARRVWALVGAGDADSVRRDEVGVESDASGRGREALRKGGQPDAGQSGARPRARMRQEKVRVDLIPDDLQVLKSLVPRDRPKISRYQGIGTVRPAGSDTLAALAIEEGERQDDRRLIEERAQLSVFEPSSEK